VIKADVAKLVDALV